MPRWFAAVVAVLVVAIGVASEARAGGALHSTYSIPRAEDGRGLKVGERATFHAGFALGTGVDSNVFSNARDEPKRPAAFVWPSGWVGIGNREVRDNILMTPPERSGRWLDYNISAIAGFRQLLARNSDVRSQPKFSIGTQLHLVLLPGRKFSTTLDGDYYLGAQPGSFLTDGRVFNFSRHNANAKLMIYLRPGGGRLSFGVGGRFALTRFLTDAVNRGNRMLGGLATEAKWRFLPRSAAVVSYTMDFTYYTDCCADVGNGRNEDNFAHRLLAGYRGQVVDKLAIEAMAGWGAGYYRQDPNGPNFNSFIGHATFSYFPTLRSVVSLTVARRFQDSLFGNFYIDNGVELTLEHQFRWRMFASIGGNVALRRIRGLPAPVGSDPVVEDDRITDYAGRGDDKLERRTTVVGMSAKLEQPLGKLFALTLGYNLYADTRPYRVTYALNPAFPDNVSFTRHLVMLIGSVRI